MIILINVDSLISLALFSFGSLCSVYYKNPKSDSHKQ